MQPGERTHHDDPAARRAPAVLTIDLGAIQENYRRLQARLSRAQAAAVVKADGYGLGAAQVAPALARAGATCFMVAHLNEAIALRQTLSEACPAVPIYVLSNPLQGLEDEFLAHNVLPVLNSLGDIEIWRRHAARLERPLPGIIQLDSGMSRLGLPDYELDELVEDPALFSGLTLTCVMSHLACAENRDNPMNARQLEHFRAALARLPRAQASLANSSGIFLGADYHFDLARPGAALYGLNPTPGAPNPMKQVVRLQGKILQVRRIDAPQAVGYGATHRVAGPMRLATVGAGYADGHLRSLSNRGGAFVGGHRVAVVGRVSMDLITLDVSAVPPDAVRPGALVDLIDPEGGPDRLAEEAGTIGYEILAMLGRRYHRTYLAG